jgi:hypothetical protein
MPITPYLDGFQFVPETKRIMGVAFEAALSALRLADWSDPIVGIVAKKIIDLARAGESNPDRLCEQALIDVRNSQFQQSFDIEGDSRPFSEPSFPNILIPPSCPNCDAVMKLARVEPAYFYQKVDQRTYACECGGTATRFVDRQ